MVRLKIQMLYTAAECCNIGQWDTAFLVMVLKLVFRQLRYDIRTVTILLFPGEILATKKKEEIKKRKQFDELKAEMEREMKVATHLYSFILVCVIFWVQKGLQFNGLILKLCVLSNNCYDVVCLG